ERTLALVKGDIDVYTGGLATLLPQIEKGQPIVMFMNTGTLGTGIVAGKDVKDWADLKGKQVETLRGSIMHMQLLDELKMHGLSDKDVQFKFATKPQDMSADLKQGNVAAISSLEPFTTEAVVDGYARFLSFPYDTQVGWRAQGAWAVRADFLKQHADVAQLMADENVALVKAYHEQPSKLLDDSMRLLNFKPDYKPIVEASMHNLALPVAIDAAGVKDIQGTAKFMVQFGQLKAVPDLSKAIDMSFVDKAEQKVSWKAPTKLYSVLTPPAWDPSFKFPTR
ncbi:MAG: ABC transporter substrate-binding protein, partial [Chloroflexota bacterium]|nr:ABC transporter substrate-binding protein [Chloroflexota bacterium]